MLLGLFYRTADRGAGAIAVLAFENRSRARRDQLVSFQDELGIEAITGRLVNGLAAEVPVESVFVIVVAAETEFLPVRCEFFLFVENDELGRAPRLPRFAHVAPKLVDRAFEVAVADEIIARRLCRDLLRRIDPRLLNSLRHRRPAAGEEKQAEQNLGGEEELEQALAHGHLPLSQRITSCNHAAAYLFLLLLLLLLFRGIVDVGLEQEQEQE